MDWVQIYFAVLLIINIIFTVYFILDGGQKRRDYTSGDVFMSYVLGIIFSMPIIGRIFGWW